PPNAISRAGRESGSSPRPGWGRASAARCRPWCSSIRSELDHVGHLVVLGIDNDDLLRSEEEPVAFDLRDLLADVARHRPRADPRRYGLADRRLNIACVGLHILDQLFDGVTLFQREIELGSWRQHVL